LRYSQLPQLGHAPKRPWRNCGQWIGPHVQHLHAPGQFRVVYPAQSIAGDGTEGSRLRVREIERRGGRSLIKTFIQCQEKYLSEYTLLASGTRMQLHLKVKFCKQANKAKNKL